MNIKESVRSFLGMSENPENAICPWCNQRVNLFEHKCEETVIKLTYKWSWLGKPIEELTNEEAGVVLKYVHAHPHMIPVNTDDNIEILRRINYSGRGLSDEELKRAGIVPAATVETKA